MAEPGALGRLALLGGPALLLLLVPEVRLDVRVGQRRHALRAAHRLLARGAGRAARRLAAPRAAERGEARRVAVLALGAAVLGALEAQLRDGVHGREDLCARAMAVPHP